MVSHDDIYIASTRLLSHLRHTYKHHSLYVRTYKIHRTKCVRPTSLSFLPFPRRRDTLLTRRQTPTTPCQIAMVTFRLIYLVSLLLHDDGTRKYFEMSDPLFTTADCPSGLKRQSLAILIPARVIRLCRTP